MPDVDYQELDPGIRRYVKIVREAGVGTLTSCEGRKNPGYHPDVHGPHHGDWPYIVIQGPASAAYMALGAALYQGLPVRSIEQTWFTYPEDPSVLVGPSWRLTFWEKDSAEALQQWGLADKPKRKR